MNEEKLIHQLRNNEPGAFEILVNMFKDKVFNTAFGFVFNEEEAEDISQEVFIEVFKSIYNFKSRSTLSTWIYRISVNKSLDAIRKKNRKKRFALTESLDDYSQVLPNMNSEHPDHELESKERKKILYMHIKKLPRNQQIVLVLNKMEGLPQKEIADIMKTSVSSVESLIFRARKTLKKQLEAKLNP